MQIQIVGLKPFAGTSAAGNPFRLLAAKCISTDSDGVVEVGELKFFESKDRPLPNLQIGQIYSPTYAFRSVKGELVLSISGLNPVKP